MRAFILRIAHTDKALGEALNSGMAVIGWSDAAGLLDPKLDWSKFQQIVHDAYYKEDGNSYRRSGNAAGHAWRFIREMAPGDLLVVPSGNSFYVATVTGLAQYDKGRIGDDTAYRREVKWENNKQAIPTISVRAVLQTRMKTQGTTADASDLIHQIQDALEMAAKIRQPTFADDLRSRLIREVLSEIRSGRIDSNGFERLIQSLLMGLGAKDAEIIPRNKDKGADIVASFSLAGPLQVRVAVQAKHHLPDPPTGDAAVRECENGMKAEGTDFGIVVSAGSFSDEAVRYARKLYDADQTRIELIDGEQLASLMIDHGLHLILDHNG